MSPVHKPLRTVGGFLTNNDLLTPRDKLSLGRFFPAGLHDYRRPPLQLDRSTVAEYAKAHGVSDRAVHNLLIPLTAELFFLPPERFSAAIFFGLLAPVCPGSTRCATGAAWEA